MMYIELRKAMQQHRQEKWDLLLEYILSLESCNVAL
ncbi:hypothetical protein VISP3789_00300 [Vibrio splendidus ATCC 33789]|nr:hypothetical protein VISP3789_00300 [Vibrio splendidus ATCC 33789]